MSKIDSLLRRADRLARSASNSNQKRERQWVEMCDGAGARLLAKIQRMDDESPETSPAPLDEAIVMEFKAMLAQSAVECKVAFLTRPICRV